MAFDILHNTVSLFNLKRLDDYQLTLFLKKILEEKKVVVNYTTTPAHLVFYKSPSNEILSQENIVVHQNLNYIRGRKLIADDIEKTYKRVFEIINEEDLYAERNDQQNIISIYKMIYHNRQYDEHLLAIRWGFIKLDKNYTLLINKMGY